MKILNKLKFFLIIIIVLSLLISYVPSAGADENNMTAEEVCKRMNYELFTDEVYFAVTRDLSLSQDAILEKIGASGVAIRWESSAPDVINESGEVFRAKYRDKTAVLTATVNDGTQTATKDFEFVVLSQQGYVYMAENFGYDVPDGTTITDAAGGSGADGKNLAPTSRPGWSFSSTGDINFKSYIYSDENANHILKSYRTGTDAAAHSTRHVFKDAPSGEVIWEADVKFDRDKPPQVYMFEIFGVTEDLYGATERIKIIDFDLRLDATATSLKVGTGYWTATAVTKPTYANDDLLNNEWSRIKAVMNTDTMEWAIYVEDKLIKDNIPFYERDREGRQGVKCLCVKDFQIGTYRMYQPDSSMYLDNISVRRCTDSYEENAALYEIIDDISFDMLTDEDPGSIQSELDLSLSALKSRIEENGLTAEWTSSDESVLYIDGDRAVPVYGKIDRTVTLSVSINGAEKTFSLTVPADEQYRSVNRVYDAIGFECFSAEPQNAVTQNIDLSKENLESILILDGINVEFKLDNTQAIGEDGAVTRGKEDEEVNLTVTISDQNGYSREKVIEITVLANDKEVYYSSNFRYPDLVGQDVSTLDKWSNTVSESDFITTLECEENNYLLSSDRLIAGTDYNFTRLSLGNGCKTEFTVDTKMKFLDNNDNGWQGSSAIYVFEVFGTYNIGGEKKDAKIAEIRFGYDYGYMKFSDADTSGTIIEMLPTLGEWFDLKLVCNALDHGADVYIDGKKLNEERIPFYYKNTDGYDVQSFESVKYIRYNSFRTKENLGIRLDDLSITGKKDIRHVCILNETDAASGETEDLISTKYIDYFAGNTLGATVKVSNGTDETAELDVLLCVYDDGKLCDIRKSPNSITLLSGECKEVSFEDISWKDDPDKLTVKSFVWKKDKASPVNETIEINSQVVTPYSPKVIPATDTDREITYIDLYGETIYKLYFSGQSWSADSKKMYFHGKNKDIYEYNTETEEIRFISKCTGYYGFVTVPSKNVLLYINSDNRVAEMNIDTYERRVVADLPSKVKTGGNLLTVTNDGKYLSLNWGEDSANFEEGNTELLYKRFPVLDTETGVWLDDTKHYYGFPEITPCNTFINPVYSNLLFFGHANQATKDRVWVIDTDTDECYNLYIQKPYTETIAGESVSHECWTYDGERLVMAINNLDTRQIGPYGVISIDKDGRDRRVINDEYGYLHLGASPVSDRWIVGDTGYNGFTTNIVLVDCYTGEAYKLATVKQNAKDSVAHGHPAFTPDGKRVYFGMYNDDYSTAGIGIIDVSDIVENAPNREIITLSENCRTESVDGFDYSVKEVIVDGVTAYETEAGKHMNVNFLGEEAENASVTITIEYYAEDAQAELEYYQWTKYTEDTPSKLETKTQSIETENGGWKTATVIIDDINLEGYGDLGGDFAINVTDGKLIIKSVKVTFS